MGSSGINTENVLEEEAEVQEILNQVQDMLEEDEEPNSEADAENSYLPADNSIDVSYSNLPGLPSSGESEPDSSFSGGVNTASTSPRARTPTAAEDAPITMAEFAFRCTTPLSRNQSSSSLMLEDMSREIVQLTGSPLSDFGGQPRRRINLHSVNPRNISLEFPPEDSIQEPPAQPLMLVHATWIDQQVPDNSINIDETVEGNQDDSVSARTTVSAYDSNDDSDDLVIGPRGGGTLGVGEIPPEGVNIDVFLRPLKLQRPAALHEDAKIIKTDSGEKNCDCFFFSVCRQLMGPYTYSRMRQERLKLQSYLLQNIRTFYPPGILPYKVKLAFSSEELTINTYTELKNFLKNIELFGLMFISHIEIGAFALLHQVSIKMIAVEQGYVYTVTYNDGDDSRMIIHVLNYKEHFSTVLLPQDHHLHIHPSANGDEPNPAPPTFPEDDFNKNFPPLPRSQMQRHSGASQNFSQHDKCDKPAQDLADSHGGHVPGNNSVCAPARHLEAQVKIDP